MIKLNREGDEKDKALDHRIFGVADERWEKHIEPGFKAIFKHYSNVIKEELEEHIEIHGNFDVKPELQVNTFDVIQDALDLSENVNELAVCAHMATQLVDSVQRRYEMEVIRIQFMMSVNELTPQAIANVEGDLDAKLAKKREDAEKKKRGQSNI